MKKASFRVKSGVLQGRTYSVSTSPFLLGRADNSNLVLSAYSRVSRRHARLEWSGDSLFIHDENSTNGVYVNGKKVSESTLKQGDALTLGDFSATVSFDVISSGAGSAVPLNQMWRDLPGNAAQKWGAVVALGLVLFLGAKGMRGQQETVLSPETMAPHTSSGSVAPQLPNIPDASMGQPSPTGIVAAIAPANGRISPVAINNVKSATVLIAHPTQNGYAVGSGFALADSGRIVTNRHVVVDDAGNPQNCLLIFEAGTPRERKVKVDASRIALAPQSGEKGAFQDDLAVISLEEGQTPALPAAASEDLIETDEVYAVGFPLGTETLTLNGDLPSASVKAARVERLQHDKNGAVTVIQLGSSVTHGNSGGPVVNNRGEVVGVISSGVDGTGMAYAIPMVFVNALSSR